MGDPRSIDSITLTHEHELVGKGPHHNAEDEVHFLHLHDEEAESRRRSVTGDHSQTHGTRRSGDHGEDDADNGEDRRCRKGGDGDDDLFDRGKVMSCHASPDSFPIHYFFFIILTPPYRVRVSRK